MKDRPFLGALISAAASILGVLLGIPFVIPQPPKTDPPPTAPAPTPPPPLTPVPVPPAPQVPTSDPWNAVALITRGGTGCSGTVIGPRRSDGSFDVLTAAHCTRGVGEVWNMKFRNGWTATMKVVSIDRQADCAWCVTTQTTLDLPFALLAAEQPKPGAKIWHGGYGVDRPGNKEEGTVGTGGAPVGQVHMRINVSNGDSGGGIFDAETGRLFSVVCCSSGKGSMANVYGAKLDRITRLKATAVEGTDWTPLSIPHFRIIGE